MANNESDVLHLKSFSELIGKIFLIPYLQRGYKWTALNVEELLNDLREFNECKNASKRVYCLQPLSSIANGNGGYTAMDLASYFGNAALTKKLEWISSLGYGYMNDKTMEMDFATQIRIWQEITPGLITNIHPEIQSKIDLINQRLHVMETPVSFWRQHSLSPDH